MLEEMIPFPREDTTPPVTKMNLGVFICQVRFSKRTQIYVFFPNVVTINPFYFPRGEGHRNSFCFLKKKSEKSLPVRKKGVPLQSRSETSGNFYSPSRKVRKVKISKSSLKRLKGKYKQVPRNCNRFHFKRASFSLEKSAKDKLRIIRIYNEEFDPGSG